MFTLFVPYLICVCIFYVIWQLHALNGFSFQLLICYFSNKNLNFSKKINKLLVHFKRLVLFSLVYLGLLLKKKK